MKTQDKQKKELLSMMKYLEDLFHRENIWYTLAYGTLLGTIREKGFIPWDIDIDICVKYTDLKRIRELFSWDMESLYHLCVPGKEAKYSSNHDRLIVKGASHFDCHIDIYALIGLPDDYDEAKKYIGLSCTVSGLFSAKCKKLKDTKKKALLIPAKLVALFFSDRFIARFYKRTSEKYPFDTAAKVSVLGAAYREVYDKSIFDNTEYRQFENEEFQCIVQYDRYLRQLYGDYTVPKKSNYVVK